ncbi:DUF397 domain-containing protein [Streptomyces bobili]|uniref:DUF397 domain-containing protein n=1 Tax=Streptomyces bobili TaxID=67280 RepID=UPI00343649D1
MNRPGSAWFTSSYSSGGSDDRTEVALDRRKSGYSSASGDGCIEIALSWRKSGYSSAFGDDCIEIAHLWHESSHSRSGSGDCDEVAALPRHIPVRDSRHKDAGPQLALSPAAWARFVADAGRDHGAARECRGRPLPPTCPDTPSRPCGTPC